MDETKTIISDATLKNWEKLGKTLNEDSLTSRANKTESLKKVDPTEYLNEADKEVARQILNEIENNNVKDIEAIINYLILQYLIVHEIIIPTNETSYKFKNENIEKYFKQLTRTNINLNFTFDSIPSGDILGYVYQSLLTEGKKNKIGSYYTPTNIVEDFIENINFENQKICDPCCGTGGFLFVIAKTGKVKPNQLYGYDIDKIATNIIKANLFVIFKDDNFYPNIYNEDFLTSSDDNYFDLIITNPPWGAKGKNYSSYFPVIKSKETFSYFLVKSIEKLNQKGIIKYLLPISILNVKTHQDIRKYILDNIKVREIHTFGKAFSGVLTDVIGLFLEKSSKDKTIRIVNDESFYIDYNRYLTAADNIFTTYNETISAVINKIQKQQTNSLENAIFGLGIVTGDNKNKLFDQQGKNQEPIYTGKEVKKYLLSKPKRFINFYGETFQQVASESIYRANEKLLYKFISNKPVFAYDNKKSLTLNSANVLIPNHDKISVKAFCLLLNSNVVVFYYKNVVNQTKMLKNDILSLPLPKITPKQNDEMIKLFNEIETNNQIDSQIQQYIYKLYKLTKEEIKIIEQFL